MYQAVNAVKEFRERLMADTNRPAYHFAVPEGDGRPGDPNGAFYADGRYHLMYLYARQKEVYHWGHISSIDLVHWRHHPDALTEINGDHGCFSGGAFVDDDGTAYLTFWKLCDADAPQGYEGSGIGIAESRPPYDVWKRWEGVVIAADRFGVKDVLVDGHLRRVGCADPTGIWKKDGKYYLQTGNLCVLNQYGRGPDAPAEMRGDWTDLFESDDLHTWRYVDRFYRRRQDNAWTEESEDAMCPTFLPLPASPEGGKPSGKYLQMFISHNKGCQYYVGAYEGALFRPERHGRMSWVDNTYFASEAVVDHKGRQIMWAWLLDNPEQDFEKYGWSGVYGLPRTLWLGEDGDLRLAPVSELKLLRYNHVEIPPATVADGALKIEVPDGAACELHLLIKCARRSGVLVRDGVMVYVDAEAGDLVMDTTGSGAIGRPACERAPFAAAEGDLVDLTVYVDHSVIEVYAGDRQAICRRVFEGGYGVSLYSLGETEFLKVDYWQIDTLNGLIQQVYEQRYLWQQSQLKQLQMQITPHFFYNSFFAVRGMLEMGKTATAIAMLENMGKYFQFITRSGRDLIPLKQEVSHAMAYCEIQKIRFENIEVDFPLPPEEIAQTIVPRLILQPLIENAYAHGLENKLGEGALTVRYLDKGSLLAIEIADDGAELAQEEVDRLQKDIRYGAGETTGMINIHNRLRLTYGEEAGLSVRKNEPAGLIVTVLIPKERKAADV